MAWRAATGSFIRRSWNTGVICSPRAEAKGRLKFGGIKLASHHGAAPCRRHYRHVRDAGCEFASIQI
jgi:hypothetical protein